jgi:epoxide hydrolase-like predicted phosphatase
MREIKWILFDLGGVLVNVEQARIFESLAEVTGLNVNHVRERVTARFPLATDFIVREYTPERVTLEINSILGTNLSQSAVVAAFNSELGETINSTASLLPELKKRAAIGCLSNTNSIHWDELLNSYEFMHAFDRRFASQIIGLAKPGQEIYQTVAENLGAHPHQILFFDDRADNVETASRLGWRARLYRDSQSLLEELKVSVGF